MAENYRKHLLPHNKEQRSLSVSLHYYPNMQKPFKKRGHRRTTHGCQDEDIPSIVGEFSCTIMRALLLGRSVSPFAWNPSFLQRSFQHFLLGRLLSLSNGHLSSFSIFWVALSVFGLELHFLRHKKYEVSSRLLQKCTKCRLQASGCTSPIPVIISTLQLSHFSTVIFFVYLIHFFPTTC